MFVKPNALGWILGAVLSMAASGAWAQTFEHLVPPETDNGGRFDLFAPPDVSAFGSGPPANEGYFFNADFIQWNVEAPRPAKIGSDSVIDFPAVVINSLLSPPAPALIQTLIGGPTSSTVDTSEYEAQADLKSGRRFEGGWVEDNYGLMFSYFSLRAENVLSHGPGDIALNDANLFFAALVVFDDTTFGPTPPFGILFREITANNIVKTSNVEVMGIYRYDRRPEPFSGQFEWLYGVRYLQWDEEFNVSTIFSGTNVQNDENHWNTGGTNQLIGPQVGFRYFKPNRRWAYAVEGRFFAAANVQSVDQQVELGELVSGLTAFNNNFLVPTASSTSHTRIDDEVEFSPSAELRAEASYTLTRRIRMRAGWTGMLVSNLARPSRMVQYTWPSFGIIAENNREDVFVNGFHLGVEINH